MRGLDLSGACVLLLATWLGQGVVATPSPAHRVLRAATKRTDLYRRSTRITKRFEAGLDYVEEENGWGGKSTFASQVKVNSQKPVLNLEEVEHHLQDVQCEDGLMKLSFVDTSSARDAYFSCYEKNGGLVITSHDSCNDEGERAVYRVHNVSFANDGEALELSVSEASWQDAFDRFDISFGHTTDDHLFRRHSDFAKIRKKRQSFNVDIPADTPDGVITGTFDLKSELIDTTFSAESFLLGLDQLVPIPALPIEIGCKRCATRGQVVLTQGAIQIDLTQIDIIPDFLQGGDDGKEITNVLSGGFVELAAIGVGARLELFARPKQSGEFEISLFPIPILGFVIPGIGKAGAVFEPRIAANFEINGGFELNYGIDVAIPDNSNIRLELTNIGKSAVNGFPGSTLTPLPFEVNVTDVDILLGLAFKPTIPVGFEFSDKLKAEAFVSMNLPRLDAKLSTNAVANCGNSSNSTIPTAPYTNKTTEVSGSLAAIGPLMLVEANISVTVDVGIGLSLPLLPPPFNDVGVDANIFSIGFPLVTACVNAGEALATVTGTVGGNTTMVLNNATGASTVYVLSTRTQPANIDYKPTSTPCNSTLLTPGKSTKYATSTMIHTSAAHANVTKPSMTASHAVSTKIHTSIAHVSMTTPAVTASHAVSTVIHTSVAHVNTTKPVMMTSHIVSTRIHTSIVHVNTTRPAMISSHAAASSHIVKDPPMAVSSLQQIHSSSSSSGSNTSTVSTSLSSASSNSTVTLAPFTLPAVSTPAPPPPPPPPQAPAPTVVLSSGFMVPSNVSAVPAQQTSPAVFTGAAVPGAEVPIVRWTSLGWQVCVVGLSVVVGALIL